MEEEKNHLLKLIDKRLRSCEKEIRKISAAIEEGKSYEKALHKAELVKANFTRLKRGLAEITVQDWLEENRDITIALKPQATPKEQLEALFKKCQKLKASIAPLGRHLEILDHRHRLWQTALEEVEKAQTLEELESIQTRLFPVQVAVKKEELAKPTPYHIFRSESGFQIFVGKNSQANHLLTFQVAHGSDLWLHAHQARGSHVLIKTKNASDVDQETIQDAMQLALYFSKARSLGAFGHEVVITERKYVSRLKTAPKGLVSVSKQKIVTAFLDKSRIDTIRRRT